MRSESPALAPVLKSDNQARLLAAVLLHPDMEFTLSDLARDLEVPLSTLHGESKRLTNAGILCSREVGRNRLLRANPDNRLVAPLTALLLASFGPDVVIGEEFADLTRVEQVLIFGSWAARFHGEHGDPPHDVDVLVVGSPDRTAVYDAAEQAEHRLGFPVNPTVVSRKRWAAADDPLVQQIRASPVVVALTHDA
jgi:DNA-binding transcriptional ArsR family regulator